MANIKTCVDLPSFYKQFVGWKTYLDPSYSWMNQHRITSGCNMYAPITDFQSFQNYQIQWNQTDPKLDLQNWEEKAHSPTIPRMSKSRLCCTFLFNSSQYWYMGKFLPTSRPLFCKRSQTWLPIWTIFCGDSETCHNEGKRDLFFWIRTMTIYTLI